MVIKKIINFIFLSFLLFSNVSSSSQIFDYETELFLDKLLLSIKEVNNYNKIIKTHIIKDPNPNAFVVTNNNLILSSGLIEQSPDYVSLIAVLAHEVGHLEYFHLDKRLDSLEQLSKLNLISNLALITGGVLASDPQVLSGAIANNANINNFYLSFSREQEREADIYSIKTIEKLNLPNNSIKKFLKILEINALNKGYNEDYQKFSTHPIFKERYEIIENNTNNRKFSFKKNIQTEFEFIKAKFMAYNNNLDIDLLDGDQKIYYESISISKKGDLRNSLKKINYLIKKFPNNIFLLETKGDILRSHGFLNESSKFYHLVLNHYPNNKYVKYKIFLDTSTKKMNFDEKNNFFKKNIYLLIHFPKNIYIVSKFIEIAKELDKNYWIEFLKILNDTESNQNAKHKDKLLNLSEKSNDKDLKKIIYKYLEL